MAKHTLSEGEIQNQFNRLFDVEARQRKLHFVNEDLKRQDVKFADHFVQGKTKAVLMEFKKHRSGASSELDKPLKVSLCNLICSSPYLNTSLQGHFLAWAEKSVSDIRMAAYVSEVCTEITCIQYQSESLKDNSAMINGVLDCTIGAPIAHMVRYLRWLDDLGGGRIDLRKVKFKGTYCISDGNSYKYESIGNLHDLKRFNNKIRKSIEKNESEIEELKAIKTSHSGLMTDALLAIASQERTLMMGELVAIADSPIKTPDSVIIELLKSKYGNLSNEELAEILRKEFHGA